MIDHRVTRAVAWYRRLLILYPLAFRQRFGDSMAEAFAAELEATRSPLGRAWLWTDDGGTCAGTKGASPATGTNAQSTSPPDHGDADA